ncbi:short-chain dehydrogenase/reductase [Histoplasma capsulatum]|uniref:Short-chain dehydrogenase/reductase n=1 Tax=Ajellomyces capsulatus TaxID=5037 RepID=A0A8A1MK58_AJECA|nr:short-chain dehydrogenase/reductase [Histoplasma capsulatum]
MDSSNLFDVKGKIILITGGAKGVGPCRRIYTMRRSAKSCLMSFRREKTR